MIYNPTQDDIRILKQSSRTIFCKLEVLNSGFKIIGSLEGEMISDSYSYDTESDIRKTANISLFVKDSSFLIGSDNKIWFNKYLRLSIGIFDLKSRQTVWYRIGTFVYTDANYSYDSVTRQLNLNLSDMTALINGSRNGKIAGLETKILAGTDIHDSIVSVLTQLGNITKYRVDDINKEVPYNLEFSAGTDVYSIVKELRDLYAGWESYFDDDTFICQEYPTTTAYPIVMDDSITKDLVLSESLSTSFNGVYNVIEVWGKCLETSTYTTDVTYSSGVYNLINAAVIDVTSSSDMYGFKASDTNTGDVSIKFNSGTAYPVCDEGNTPIATGRIEANKSYVVKYVANGSQSYFYFCGEYQICAVAKLMSREPTIAEKAADILANPTKNIEYVIEPDSPFCVDLIGEYRDVKSSGEYENIYSEDLAMQRAKYELWLTSDMKDTLDLTMIDIPWLDVNQKIEYTSLNTGLTGTYIIKKKNSSTTNGTMTLNCVKFVPLYSWQ